MSKRIQRKRAKGWRLPEGAMCVTRPSVFGNPFTLPPRATTKQRRRCVQRYEQWLEGTLTPLRLRSWRRRLLARLPELFGKDLACYCPEGERWCHADVLLRHVHRSAT